MLHDDGQDGACCGMEAVGGPPAEDVDSKHGDLAPAVRNESIR